MSAKKYKELEDLKDLSEEIMIRADRNVQYLKMRRVQ